MATITQNEWIADLNDFTCRNINNRIVVSFEKSGKTYIGKIKEIPFSIKKHWANFPNGNELVKKAVMKAEEVFLKACAESDFEKNGTSDNIFKEI